MPAYEYECRECGDHFERRQKMSEAEIDSCPACGGAVKRLISGGAGAITKGGSAATPACGMGACQMSAGGCCGGGACAH
ncbi:MAG TPA: zinc ribbon domain-containing protein [Terracidiphilus sp.]|jgi:putative FmdB family regulatory protein